MTLKSTLVVVTVVLLAEASSAQYLEVGRRRLVVTEHDYRKDEATILKALATDANLILANKNINEKRKLQGMDGSEIPSDVTVCDESQSSKGAVAPYLIPKAIPFCMNRGACKEDFAEQPDEPCECLAGYDGPHCEFEEGKVPECTLQCSNGGTCTVGAKSWQQVYNEVYWQSDIDMQYCECPKGAHGILCEIKGEACGDSYCYNGGTCIETQNTDGTVQNYCDCTTAGDDKVKYAGQFCQSESSTFCSEFPDHNGHHFCVNGGTCKGESHLGCDCPDGFVGPICEFEDMNIEPVECTLQCENDGICRKGAKDLSILKEFGVDRHLLNESYTQDFEHCVCPIGHVGLRCEYDMMVCPGAQHVCMHGGGCIPVMEGSDLRFDCDCSAAQDDSFRFMGDMCEMESTQFCTVDGKKTENGQGDDAFCTNNGKCKALVEHGQDHPGCNCPKGFAGPHCEYESGKSNAGLIAGLAVGLTVLTLLVLGSACHMKHRRQRFKMHLDEIDSPMPPTMENIRSLDSWMSAAYNDSQDLGDYDDNNAAAHDDSTVNSKTPSNAASSAGSAASSTTSTHSLKLEESADGTVSLMKLDTVPSQEIDPGPVNETKPVDETERADSASSTSEPEHDAALNDDDDEKDLRDVDLL